jgi:transposase
MMHMIEGLMQDWHHPDERIESVTEEIEAVVAADEACQRLMSRRAQDRSLPVPW